MLHFQSLNIPTERINIIIRLYQLTIWFIIKDYNSMGNNSFRVHSFFGTEKQ